MVNIALVDRYSKALFELVLEQGLEDEMYKDFFNVAIIFKENYMLKRAFASNRISSREKRAILGEIFDRLDSPELLRRFLYVVLENRREERIYQIYKSYQWRYRKYKKIKPGTLKAPFPVSRERIRSMEEFFSEKLGGRVEIISEVDKSLIGGVVLKIEDTVYTDDIRSRLDRLTNWMKG